LAPLLASWPCPDPDLACFATQHIDLRTATKEDLSFKVPFELTATRNDCEFLCLHHLPRSSPSETRKADMCLRRDVADIHAFLGWFDIDFSCCHKPIKFSTGPHAKVRHPPFEGSNAYLVS
jgi:protein arginine N-methyltransferase 1